ncbi:protein takeout isoform X2 [Zootermopsis nevadensis]|uniref:protein takeout isoform X2 n=1 Tax=Zootermopsis nevadensis TaxID=136037 RepID=UPI000B8EDBCF|nr:protein takeout isoform X2 [Zootermopsis nevadensis]
MALHTNITPTQSAVHTMAPSYLLLVALAVFLKAPPASAQDKKIPDFIKLCKRSDPQLNECITDSVEHLKPALEKGVEGIVPSLEPLRMNEVPIIDNNGLRIVGKDVKTYGCSDFRIFNMKADVGSKMDLEFDLELPMLYTVAQYEVSGRILLIPIKGNGPFYGNWSECTAHVTLDGDLEDRSGFKFVRFNTLRIVFTMGKGRVELRNLFNGDKVLGDAVNSAINSNFKQVLKELQHPIEKALEDAILEIANDCVRDFTYDQLFPLE